MNEPTKGELVRMDASINLEDVAAIKVSETEVDLIQGCEQLRADIKSLQDKTSKLKDGLVPAMIEDTKKNYPEIAKLEKMLQSFCGSKNVQVSIQFAGDGKRIAVILHGNETVAWRGKKSKGIQADMDKNIKEIDKLNEKLVDVRKKLCQLPALERSTKAAVAKHRLSQSKDGKALLSQISKVDIPGLPAPKK